jgi:carbamoyl-phosphate synthase small subunit
MKLIDSYLILKNGKSFKGKSPYNQKDCIGEAVFNTGMTGYVESLTDPSYYGQLLTFTYPLLGNYGVPCKEKWESAAIQAKGVIFSSISAHWHHHKSVKSLTECLTEYSIPWISEVDTRELTKQLRNQGTMVAGIFTSNTVDLSKLNESTKPTVECVSIKEKKTFLNGKRELIVVDCGIKKSILNALKKFKWTIHQVPYNYDYSQDSFDAVFLSNGPGDPSDCGTSIKILKKAMLHKKPIFGICLGSQILALAAGANTYKLPFGHRGHNQPCINSKEKKCYITSQNHGYAVDEKTLPKDWFVSYKNLNDDSVEGIQHQTLPFFSVQFHPEAAPGPTDTYSLFKDFYETVAKYE